MTIISIGSVIKSLLTNNQELNKKISGKIFPLVAPLDTEFPFITYSRNSNVESNKDTYSDNASLDIIVVSDRYDESIEIAEMVRSAMTIKKQEINGFKIQKITLQSTNEMYNDAYVQQLIFTCIVEK